MNIEAAAFAYVKARLRLLDAAGSDLLVRAVDVDMAWHELHTACGIAWPDCCDEEPERHYASGRKVRTEKPL